MSIILQEKIKNKIGIVISSLVAVLYVMRSAYPTILNYFYALSILISALYFPFYLRKEVYESLIKSVKILWAYILVFICFFIASSFVRSIYIAKELINGIIAIYIFILWLTVIKTQKQFNLFRKVFINSIASLASILALLRLLLIIKPGGILGLRPQQMFSLASDHNIYALLLILGLFCIISILNFINGKWRANFLTLFFFIIVINVFLTGSRRGIIVLSVLLFVFYLKFFLGIFYKNHSLFFKNTRIIAISFTIFLPFSFWILLHISPQLKHQFVFNHKLGDSIKSNIAYPISKYLHQPIDSVYDFIWYNNYKGFYYHLYYPIFQEYLDSKFIESNKDYFENRYLQKGLSGTRQWGKGRTKLSRLNDTINVVTIISEGMNDGIAFYIDVPKNTTITNKVYIYVHKWSNNLRLMTLSGGAYQSFAIPSRWVDNHWHLMELSSNYQHKDLPRIFILGGESSNKSIFSVTGFVSFVNKNNDDSIYNCCLPTAGMNNLITNMYEDKSNVSHDKNVVSKLKSNNLDDLIAIPLDGKETFGSFNTRLRRWQYAFELWGHYNLFHKLFGNSFNYLYDYGDKFYNNRDRMDYPHNPFISSLLYSGLIGFIIYLIFTIDCWRLFLDNFKELQFEIVLFLIVFLFSFISGNSHFSIPAFVLMCLYPFLYQTIKEKS